MDKKHNPNHNQEDQDYENALRALRSAPNVSMEEIITLAARHPISDEEHIARLEHLARKLQE